MKRSTLGRPVSLPAAPGVLSRRMIATSLEPVEIGAGLRLRRADTGEEWAMGLESLTPATHCTAVGGGGNAVAYVEHALAALGGAGISDVRIVTDGPELPLFDGSALAWWAAIQEGGRVASATDWEPVVVQEPCSLIQGDKALLALPADHPSYTYLLSYQDPLIGEQWARWRAGEDFGEELAWARTFATAEQVKHQTGTATVPPEAETLAVVVYGDRLSAPLRTPDAFARHKVVDLVGDLFLAGRPVWGEIIAVRTGHGENHALLDLLLA